MNFGRGCKPLKVKKSGKDLIVLFKGKGNGFAADEFAPKMIGRYTNGGMLYGYARLPYVNYRPALLSARRPAFDREKGEWTLEVQNFGLSASSPCLVEIRCNGAAQGQIEVKALEPYETVKLALKPLTTPSLSDKPAYEVVFIQEGIETERNVFGE